MSLDHFICVGSVDDPVILSELKLVDKDNNVVSLRWQMHSFTNASPRGTSVCVYPFARPIICAQVSKNYMGWLTNGQELFIKKKETRLVCMHIGPASLPDCEPSLRSIPCTDSGSHWFCWRRTKPTHI